MGYQLLEKMSVQKLNNYLEIREQKRIGTPSIYCY